MGEDIIMGLDHIEQLKAVQNNDKVVMKSLYHANFKRVEAYILKNQGNEEEAKDIYQEAFIALWRNVQLNKFTPENSSSFSAYLYRIAQNKWIDYLRTCKSKKMYALPDNIELDDKNEISQEENDLLDIIKEKLKELGDNCRTILTKFYYQKQSLREIAQLMNWTEATARNNKYRCIERLRSLVKIKK